MLRRDRLPNRTWAALCDDDRYLEPTPPKQACWLVTLTCTVVMMAGVIACCWAIGAAESVALVLFR